MSSTLLKEKAKDSRRNILIVGVGNRLFGDEGAGLHIIDRLSQIPIPSHVDVVDCGCDLLSLASYANNPQKIIVIDAIRAGGKPGRVYRFDYAELGATGAQTHSAHQLRALDSLELLKQVYPDLANWEITLIGIEPGTIGLSTDLSKEVSESVADVIRSVLEEIPLQFSLQQRPVCEKSGLCRSCQESFGK